MSEGKLDIDLLNTSFSIQTSETADYLASIYSHYKDVVKQVEQVSKFDNRLKVAILAGILITDELYKERLKVSNSDYDLEVEKSADRMIMALNKVMDNETGNDDLG